MIHRENAYNLQGEGRWVPKKFSLVKILCRAASGYEHPCLQQTECNMAFTN